jgi:hypothetical protein
VKVAPAKGARDWHGNHNPAWSTREFPPDVTRAEVYPTTLIVRTLIVAVLAGLLIYTRDPLFISLLVVVGFGMILTGTSYALDRRSAA